MALVSIFSAYTRLLHFDPEFTPYYYTLGRPLDDDTWLTIDLYPSGELPVGQQQATLSSAFNIRDHEAQFTSLDVARGSSHVTGTAALNLLSNAFTFNVHGGVIDLATLPELQSSRVTLAGKLTFVAQGSGTTDEDLR